MQTVSSTATTTTNTSSSNPNHHHHPTATVSDLQSSIHGAPIFQGNAILHTESPIIVRPRYGCEQPARHVITHQAVHASGNHPGTSATPTMKGNDIRNSQPSSDCKMSASHVMFLSHQAVRASGNHPCPVGVEGGRCHRLRVRRHRAQAFAGRHVPDLHLLVERPAHLDIMSCRTQES